MRAVRAYRQPSSATTILLSGRDGSFVDVVANTLGALVGAVLVTLLRAACPAVSR